MEENLKQISTDTYQVLRQKLVKAIELQQNDVIYKLVERLEGVNISEPEVKGKLPKRWRHVASSCLTTPLRMSISWRNQELLEHLLTSKCIITQSDKNLALQKILATSTVKIGNEEIEIIRVLIKNSAVVGNVTHMATALHNSYHNDKEIFNKLVKTILAEGNNEQKGLLLLGFYLRDRNPRPGSAAQKHSSENWQQEVDANIRKVYLSGFDPGKFLKDNLINKNETARLVQALPCLLLMAPSIDYFTVASILRKAAVHYPLINIESKPIMTSLCSLLVLLGYDVGVINDIAKCPRQFNNILGFREAAENPKVLSMQENARVSIRHNIAQPNVLLAVEQLGLPTKLSDYLLMKDSFSFGQ